MATWVLLHGTPLTPAVWAGTAAALTDQPVVVPDCTSVPAGEEPQQALARSVLDGLGAGPLDVVGHSFGGQVALELALASPHRVRSLTILCSRDTPFPAFAAVAAQLRSGTPPSADASLSRWFTEAELQQDGEAVAGARAALTAASLDDWAAAVDAIATYDRRDQRLRLSQPVALVAAGHDGVSTPDVMRELADGLPAASYRCVDEWAHMSPFVDPGALAAMLTSLRDATL